MTQVLWHGRGGQGAFTASRLLGSAFALKDDNSYALAFPSFGPERRGAPIRAFTKLDDKPIGNRSEIDKADFVIFLDETLFDKTAINQLKQCGKIIVATKQSFNDPRIVEVDAVSIAEEILHLPITNTTMLGAFAALYNGITLEDINNAIRMNMASKLIEKNIAAVKASYDSVKDKLSGVTK